MARPARRLIGMAVGLAAITPWLGQISPLPAHGRPQPAPPASRPTVYNPDPATCQAAAIRSGFARQLQPYADQPPAVLEQLRQVQWQFTLASLKRCVAKGLMAETEARALAAELGGDQPAAPSQRP